MSDFQPTTVSPPDTFKDDPRIGHLLGENIDDPLEARAVLLGFPSDEGVRINGGRPGAADAPDMIRDALYSMTPDARTSGFADLVRRTVDVGNLKLGGRLEDHQTQLGRALAPYLARGVVPIVLGGGHETAYGHFRGYVEAERSVAILNWDAHADVRPLRNGRAHSGSPFRQALEDASGRCAGYTVAGLLPHSTATAHVEYLTDQGGQAIWANELAADQISALYAGWSTPVMATFDLDAVDQRAAPGVSAPAVGGIALSLWREAAYWAGRCPQVTSFDLVEYNPRVDSDGCTARVAALTVWEFLRGLAARSAEAK